MVDKMHPADIAKVIRHLSSGQEKRTIFDLIKKLDIKATVISEIDTASSKEILSDMPATEVVMILKELPTDDTADILGELPEDKAKGILQLMRKEDSLEVEGLLKYPEETAGGIMTTSFFALQEDVTAQEAIRRLQEEKEAEMVFYIYVVDQQERLVGVISLRQLLLVPPDTPLRKIMTTEVLSVHTDLDQEEVARQVARYNLLALPVVDRENRLVGIITVDDVIDVIREEATEDILKMAGTAEEELLLTISSFNAARFRLPWLLTNLVGGIVTGGFLWFFRLAIQEVIALASFIPVITAMGGNIGLQTSTIMVRGMATGRIELADIWKVFFKELRVGALMGFICGFIVGVVAELWHGNLMLGVVVGVSMFIAITVAAAMGTLVPVLLKRLGVDPAISAGPFVTTANDITGLVIYLSLATTLLRYLR
jgi:magnesium transporter